MGTNTNNDLKPPGQIDSHEKESQRESERERERESPPELTLPSLLKP